MLDPLVGIVHRFIDEPSAVVGAAREPVRGQPIGEPHPPADDEPLRQIQISHRPDHLDDCDGAELPDRHPKAVDARITHGSVARAGALERGLQRRVQVVAVVAEQYADPHCDHHRQQQQTEQAPHRDALSAGEICTRDAPEFAAPLSEPDDRDRNDKQTCRADRPGHQNPA